MYPVYTLESTTFFILFIVLFKYHFYFIGLGNKL
jgi:hypothetical protein